MLWQCIVYFNNKKKKVNKFCIYTKAYVLMRDRKKNNRTA